MTHLSSLHSPWRQSLSTPKPLPFSFPLPLPLPLPLLVSQSLLHQNWTLYLRHHSLPWPHTSLDAWVLCFGQERKRRAGKKYLSRQLGNSQDPRKFHSKAEKGNVHHNPLLSGSYLKIYPSNTGTSCKGRKAEGISSWGSFLRDPSP